MTDEKHDEQNDEPEAPDDALVEPEPGPDEDEPGTEGDEGDEPEQTGDEPEAVVPEGPQPPQTEKEMERRQKAWAAERDRHMEKAKAADDYRYSISVVCPFCEGHGLMFNPQTPEEQAQLRTFVLSVVGEATPEELHDHPKYHRCETCDGYGKVRTGSRVANQEALNCPDCNGQGHTGGASNVAQLPTPAPPGVPAAAVPQSEQERIGPDAWGRPPGHPHYSKLPAEVI